MALEPYASHVEVERTLNSVDGIFIQESNGYNPVFSVLPADGQDYNNGVIGYITIGVDPTANGIDDSNPAGTPPG